MERRARCCSVWWVPWCARPQSGAECLVEELLLVRGHIARLVEGRAEVHHGLPDGVHQRALSGIGAEEAELRGQVALDGPALRQHHPTRPTHLQRGQLAEGQGLLHRLEGRRLYAVDCRGVAEVLVLHAGQREEIARRLRQPAAVEVGQLIPGALDRVQRPQPVQPVPGSAGQGHGGRAVQRALADLRVGRVHVSDVRQLGQVHAAARSRSVSRHVGGLRRRHSEGREEREEGEQRQQRQQLAGVKNENAASEKRPEQ